MNNEKQINFIEAQINDLDYLIEKADKGYDVGDILKIEAKREQLANKLEKLLNSKDSNKIEIKEEDMTAIEIYKMREKVEKLEKAKNSRKYKVLAVIIFIWMTIVAVIGVNNSNRINIDKANKYNKINYCYSVLLNEDIIGNSCDKVFENENWYKDYLEEVEELEKEEGK